jgi:hypothetical protein
MKRLYILLFILTFSNVFAQEIPWKTDLKLSPGTKYLHLVGPYDTDEEYFFDKEGKLEKCISITYLQTFRSERFYEGNLLIKEEHFYDDKLSYIHKYDYEDGNLILETEIDVELNLIQSQKSYCYSDGKLSSKLVVLKNGIDVTDIAYTDDGSITEIKQYYGEDKLQRLVRVVEYDNVTVSEIVYYDSWGKASKETRKFIYDKNKNLVEESIISEEANLVNKFEYVGNLIVNAKYYDAKGLWMEELYDKKGNIIKEERPDTESQNEEITLFENYYNKHGDLIKVKKNGRATIKKIKIKYW